MKCRYIIIALATFVAAAIAGLNFMPVPQASMLGGGGGYTDPPTATSSQAHRDAAPKGVHHEGLGSVSETGGGGASGRTSTSGQKRGNDNPSDGAGGDHHDHVVVPE